MWAMLLVFAFAMRPAHAQNGIETLALDRAQQLSQGELQSEAERLLLDSLRKDPQSQRAHVLLGLVRYREGHPDRSLDEYSAARKLGPLNADDFRIVGLDYVQLHDLPSAERWLHKSIDLVADDWRTWRYLGGVQYSEEHPADAADSFGECLRLDPENTLAEDGLARSHEAMGETTKAGEEHRLAVEYNARSASSSALPLLHYGSYLRNTTAGLPQAIACLKQAVKLNGNDWEAHSELGQAYRDAGQLALAEQQIRTAISLGPDHPRLHFILARIYQREAEKDKAAAEIKLYKAIAAKDSANRELLDK
jgi:Tfp pilus assembly protein PilF